MEQIETRFRLFSHPYQYSYIVVIYKHIGFVNKMNKQNFNVNVH